MSEQLTVRELLETVTRQANKISELEDVVKHFCYAVKVMPVCDSYLYSIVEGIEQAKTKGGDV